MFISYTNLTESIPLLRLHNSKQSGNDRQYDRYKIPITPSTILSNNDKPYLSYEETRVGRLARLAPLVLSPAEQIWPESPVVACVAHHHRANVFAARTQTLVAFSTYKTHI